MTLAANFARPGRLARPFWHLAQHLHTRQCCVRARRRGRFGEQNWGEEHCLACSAAASSCLVWMAHPGRRYASRRCATSAPDHDLAAN